MQEALLNGIKSGSTAAVVLVADGQYLAANVGDSKAFMCSEGYDKGFTLSTLRTILEKKHLLNV